MRGGAASAVAAALLMGVLLAGCSGGGPDQPGGLTVGGRSVSVSAAPQAGKGAIAGVVVDEAIRPVAGAEVAVAGEALARSGEDGVFVLDALEPGSIVLTVSAAGYLTVQTSADVVAGGTANVRVLLPRDLRPQPYRVTYSHDGFMQAWGGIAHYFVEDAVPGGTAACDCRVHFPLEPNATMLVYEAYWDDVVPDPAEQAEFYWVVDQGDGPGNDEGYCTSPCVQRVSLRDYDRSVETYARLDGADAWPAAQQKFQLFVTVWANGEAPPDWTVASAGA